MDTADRDALVDRLVAIFPAFRAEWKLDTAAETWPSTSLHGVYQSFLPWLGTAQPSHRQWQQLARLIDTEVAADGERENAVATCFLEHCGQVGIAGVLRPLLGAEARKRMHA